VCKQVIASEGGVLYTGIIKKGYLCGLRGLPQTDTAPEMEEMELCRNKNYLPRKRWRNLRKETSVF
jgi:hypothetical protein